MAVRLKAADLARLLNAASRPIYVLDEELRLKFVNEACLEWLAVGADELLGRQCKYHTPVPAAGPEAVAAALCPPPDVLEGKAMAVYVAPPREPAAFYRRVRFLPLGESAGEVIGVVAIVDPKDLAAPPISPASLHDDPDAMLHDLVRRFRHEAAGRARPDRLVGRSAVIRRAQRQVEAAAGSRCSVLLVGPPGSGKQRLAAAIHYGGAEPRGSLTPLDCLILDAELLRSTVAALAGGAAGRGTLVLAAVDQAPPEAQPALAELLGRALPLRVIATSERPLNALIRDGLLREDLAAAISTMVVELPPLCERREDIAPLAQLFLEEANAAGGKQLARFSPEALDLLDAYHWPGNADELAGFVAEAHRRAAGAEVAPGDLPERVHLAAKAAAHPRRAEQPIVLDEFLARVERELIVRALGRAKGNKAKAARLLGLTRPRLYRRMVQLGLEQPPSPEQEAKRPPAEPTPAEPTPAEPPPPESPPPEEHAT